MAQDRSIFVNLPVADLQQTVAFFTALGFEFNPTFASDYDACMIIGEKAYAMLLTRDFFRGFLAEKAISDATLTTEVLVAITAPDRESVDAMVENAVAAGGAEHRQAADYGWMYQRSFQDLDGHIWEVIFMDEDQMPEEMKARSAQK